MALGTCRLMTALCTAMSRWKVPKHSGPVSLPAMPQRLLPGRDSADLVQGAAYVVRVCWYTHYDWAVGMSSWVILCG